MDSPYCASLMLAISLLILGFIHIAQSQGCNERPGWAAKPLNARAREASHIVYGRVTGIYAGAQPTEYSVEMDITCVLKGGATVGRANVTEVGDDCVDSAMRKGVSYLVFVHVLRDGTGRNRYVTHDVNNEMSANRATKENFAAVRQGGVNNQCNTASYSPAVEPEAGPDAGRRPGANNPNNGRNGGGNGSPALLGSTLCLVIASLYSLSLTL